MYFDKVTRSGISELHFELRVENLLLLCLKVSKNSTVLVLRGANLGDAAGRVVVEHEVEPDAEYINFGQGEVQSEVLAQQERQGDGLVALAVAVAQFKDIDNFKSLLLFCFGVLWQQGCLFVSDKLRTDVLNSLR